VKLPCGEGGGERGCGRGAKGEARGGGDAGVVDKERKRARAPCPGPGGVGERGRFRLRVDSSCRVRARARGASLDGWRAATVRAGFDAPHRTAPGGVWASFWGGFHDIFSARAPVVHTTKTC
jgi:hypothetical protein